MIKDLFKKGLVYGPMKLRYTVSFNTRLVMFLIKNVFFNKSFCRLAKMFLIKHDSRDVSCVIKAEPALQLCGFLGKKDVLKFTLGFNVFLIVQTNKNVFISWLDAYGLLKSTESLMTLNDPKKNITKKQKRFSTYFLLRKYSNLFLKRYEVSSVALILKGSFGIRHKKSLSSAVMHSGLKISFVLDITNVPFNGCRLKRKKRR
jgi:ribosomal protein S11